MNNEIVLAGGCFWGSEALVQRIPGILETTVGYANSKIPNPSYEQVCTGDTDAVEAVLIRYDDEILPLEKLLQIYFRSIDPTSLNQQGEDEGTQYRTGIYYVKPADLSYILPVYERVLAEVKKNYSSPIQTEFLPLENFYPAEEYHQDYLKKNPHGYCHVNLDLVREFGI